MSAMRVVLITWAKELDDKLTSIRGLADEVDTVAPKGPPELKAIGADPPDAVVIDLDRRPSEGLVMGIYLRRQPPTRHVPQVFAGGAPEKVDRVRAILSDARYADWDGVSTQLRTAIERPPEDPIVPDTMAPYAGVPLEQKLGATGSATVRLISPPKGFAEKLGKPRQTDGPAELVILFVRTPDELEQELEPALEAVAEGRSIWIAWPKGGKADRGELTQQLVQQRGLDEGWVDYKVASFDDTWSGLRFKRRA
jgi:CheY-like chemotaxis protein